MVTAKVWVLAKRPLGEPTLEDFKLQEEKLPACGEGGEAEGNRGRRGGGRGGTGKGEGGDGRRKGRGGEK